MKKIIINIVDIQGTGVCPKGHLVGDTFSYPDTTGDLCPVALHVLFPAIRVYRFGGKHPWEKEDGKARLCCCDPDNPVVFEIIAED